MVPTHFHYVDGDLSQCRDNIWIIQNSDSDLVTSCFAHILISMTRSFLLYFVLGSLAALIYLQVVVVKGLNMSKTWQTHQAPMSSAEVS